MPQSSVAAGAFRISEESEPPASISRTFAAGSADSRLASTHPADPAPTMM